MEPEPEASPRSEQVDPPREKDYEWGPSLGQGTFGTVKLGTVISTGKKYAVKVIEKQDLLEKKKTKEIVFRERTILNHLGKHPFVVTLHYTFQSPSSLFFVMDYCPNGEMFSHLKKLGSFSMTVTKHYIAEMVIALEYMHSKGVMHRDFKPENILFNSDWHIKVIDFGTAKNIGLEPDASSGSFEGTPEYMSPEILIDNKADFRCDFWAVGVIVYQLLTGKLPFRGNNLWHTMQKVRERDFKYPSAFPEVAKDLCEKLMEKDLDKRLNAKTIKSHPFFAGIDWDNLLTSTPPKLEPMNPPIVMDIDDSSSDAPDSTENVKGKGKQNEQEEEEEKAEPVSPHPEQSTWKQFLEDGENIVKTGIVFKKRRAFNVKKRQLILTDKCRLIYAEPVKMTMQGEVPLNMVTSADAKSQVNFIVHTVGRDYLFEDKSKGAKSWVEAINRYVGKKSQVNVLKF